MRLIDAVADSDEQGLGDKRRGKSDHRSPHLEAGVAMRDRSRFPALYRSIGSRLDPCRPLAADDR